jgi:hypothetical protein
MTILNPPNGDNPDDDHVEDRLAHARVGALFLGPKAENHDFLERIMTGVLRRHRDARRALYTTDPALITTGMMAAAPFLES